MSSTEIFFTVIFVITGLILLGSAMGMWLKRRREEETAPWPEPNLADPMMRERMRDLLSHYAIRGSCDIRDGEVFPACQPGRTNSMAAALMALYQLHGLENPNLALFVAKRDGGFAALPLDIGDLRMIAELLEKKT